MTIDKLSVFAMVFHPGSYTAPHGLVRSGIHPVMTWTCGSEIDITTMLRVLGGKNMIVHGSFIIVGIFRLRIHAEQTIGQS